MAEAGIELNGIRYRWPERPVVVVCIDGGDPAYFESGLSAGIIPTVARFMRSGYSGIAQGTIPSFTCPNNMSIATGAPAAVHGISGNFYLDRDSGEAVVMTGPELLRSGTVLGTFSRQGARVVSITAKDKLREQLGKDFDLSGGSVNFSSQCADQCRRDEHGIEACWTSSACRCPTCIRWSCRCSCSRRACACLRRGGPTSCTCR